MTTTAEPAIRKSPAVCGGAARVRDTRIPVWLLVHSRKLGLTEQQLLDDYPGLSREDLDAAWQYYRDHSLEIEQAIWQNDTAANVPLGGPVPSWVLVSARLLGLADDEILGAFDPPLTEADLTAAWDEYRSDPARISRDILDRRRAG